MRVNPETEGRIAGQSRTADTPKELRAVFEAYNATAPPESRAFGKAPDYRMVRVEPFHYSFSVTKSCITVGAHGNNEPAARELLRSFAGNSVGNAQGVLEWDDVKRRGLGQLQAQFPLETPAETVAQAMRDLIALTQVSLNAAIRGSANDTVEPQFIKASAS
jgi:hypothetical protein